MNAPPILFVGAGRIGVPIIRRMIARGLDVHVSDASTETLGRLARDGVTVAERGTLSWLTHSRAVLCLPDAGSSTAIIADWSQHGLPANTIVTDLTTMPPSAAKKNAEVLGRAGGTYLDSPVSGGQRGAESGDMVVVVGGPGDAFETMLPIFRAIGNTVHHAGEVGSASLVKAINQFVYLSYNLAFAQGLRLGSELGLPDAVVIDTLAKGAPGHPLINDRLPHTLQSKFSEGFLLKNCLKDLDCLEVSAGSKGPAVAAYDRLRGEIREAVENGLGSLDILVLSQPNSR